MVIACDTSFLFSLYGTDVHSPKTVATHFLTFDGNQKKLAEAEGLIVPL
jgi:hypothetical protein